MARLLEIWRQLEAKDKISFFFSAAGILGVIFVILQINLAVQSIESNTAIYMSHGVQELNKIFIEKPHLWPYFNAQKKLEKNDENYNAVLALADFHLDLMESIWIQSDNIKEYETDPSSWQGWENWMRSIFKDSPVMCPRLKKVKSWYSQEFVEYIGKPCKSTLTNDST